MPTIQTGAQVFEVDELGFLLDGETWNEQFAEAVAAQVQIHDGLTEDHWQVIRFIRENFTQTGTCPLVYQACRSAGLRLRDLRRLFPSGYLRGACKLAGLTYAEGYVSNPWAKWSGPPRPSEPVPSAAKVYQVDVRGFLVDPEQWDERFALHRAQDMEIPGGLSRRHWRILRCMREFWDAHHRVPTVYEVCDAHGIDLDELERLFPRGYHRGAVKLAGLRVR